MKKIIAVVSCVLLLSACFIPCASAAKTGSFSVLCYIVAGLPDISFLTGGESVDVQQNQIDIAKFVVDGGYDIFATQEDFGYHDSLAGNLTGYNYATIHHGGIPCGDGTNVFTKSMAIYNEEHIPWDTLYGVADNGADEYSQKGVTYVCIELADGIYLDFYDLHADAYGDAGSVAARRDNWRQLAEILDNRTVDRPLIITGDFNTYLYPDDSDLMQSVVKKCGLKDSWTEVLNGGDYTGTANFLETYPEYKSIAKWGKWDSVERFFYKDGGGVTLTADSFEYITILNRKGVSCSDHSACAGTFTYTVTGTNTTGEGELEVVKADGFAELIRRIRTFFEALILAFENIDALLAYVGL